MPYSYTIEENVVERGLCQQVPSKEAGDMWFDDSHRLCVVDSVSFERYVWEDVALWHVHVTAYPEEEITADLREKYAQFQQKRLLEEKKLKDAEEEKKRKWREDSKWRKIDIGVGGRFIVEVHENGSKTILSKSEGENNNAPKVIVPPSVNYINDRNGSPFSNNDSIIELVFIQEQCSFDLDNFSIVDCPNLEKIVLPGQAEFEGIHFVGCDKLESIEFNGKPEESFYYAVIKSGTIIVFKKAKHFVSHGITAMDDVAMGVDFKGENAFCEIPQMVNSITDNALYSIYKAREKTMIIPHDLTIYCTDFKKYDDAAPFNYYCTDPKEREIILGKDTKINLVHVTAMMCANQGLNFNYEHELSIKTFMHIVEEGNSPTIQYGIRVFRGWGDKYDSKKEINDIRGLFTKNVKITYR